MPSTADSFPHKSCYPLLTQPLPGGRQFVMQNTVSVFVKQEMQLLMVVCPIHNDTVSTLHACMQEHVEAGLGGRPEVGVRGLLQLADEEPQARLTLEAQEAARAAFSPAEECRESMLNLRCPSSLPVCLPACQDSCQHAYCMQ